MLIVAKGANGERIEYHDRKRYLWLLSLTVPLPPIIAVWLYHVLDQNSWVLFFPFAYTFTLIPLLDAIFGEDPSDPPPEILEIMEHDLYYRVLLYVAIFLFWLSAIVTTWFVGTHEIPILAMIFLAISVGQNNGTAITVGHEFGHRSTLQDKLMSKLMLALSAYGHFAIEHNRGHHAHVATPEDSASARYGENLYHFFIRDSLGALTRGWGYETERLRRKGHRWWHWSNDILHSYAISAVAVVTIFYLFGLAILPFMAIAFVTGWMALSQANYVEHYGLLRQRDENGKYEPCAPRHSWNTNHVVSNLMLFHLQRHSDHHTYPLRPYQTLRNFDDLPSLPSGYPGSFWLAAVPPLWFKVMNPKALDWAGGDEKLLNHG